MLKSLGRFAAEYARTIVAFWLLAFIFLAYFALHFSEVLSPGGFEVVGSSSYEAKQLLRENFPDLPLSQLLIVIKTDDEHLAEAFTLTQDLTQTTFTEKYPELKKLEPLGQPLRTKHGDIVFVLGAQLNITLDDSVAFAKTFVPEVQSLGTDGVELYATGPGAIWTDFDIVNKKDLQFAEMIQMPLLFIVLFAFLGSILLAFEPLIAAGMSIVVTFGFLYFVSNVIPLSVYVENVVPLIGIGVCIDYTLLILSRFRDEMEKNHDVILAAEQTGATACKAILYSGFTVSLALSGLLFTQVPLFVGFAIGTISVVLVAILFSLTGTPALLTLYYRARGASSVREKSVHRFEFFWKRWAHYVMDHAVMSTVLTLAVFVVLTIPVFSLEVGTSGPSSLPPEMSSSHARTLISDSLGSGVMAPVEVVVVDSQNNILSDGPLAERIIIRPEVERFMNRVVIDREVSDIPATLLFAQNQNVIRLLFIPKHLDDSDETFAFVERVKEYSQEIFAGTSISAYVSGPTSEYKDFTLAVTDNLTLVFVFVMSMCFLVLFILFKSILIPLKAVFMTLLSTTAAYGVLVIVFQYGYGANFLDFTSIGHLTNWVLPFLFCVLFGLSVDYEIFILAKIQEYRNAGLSDKDAIAQSIADTAPIITTAALVMVITFLCFLTNRLLPMKEVSLGLAVAIFLDATIVRLVLVPALMHLAGSWNWWLPQWLKNILPDDISVTH